MATALALPAMFAGHAGSASGVSGDDIAAAVTPRPQYLATLGGQAVLDGDWQICLDADAPEYAFSGTWFNDHITTTRHIQLPIANGGETPLRWRQIIVGDPAAHPYVRDALERRGLLLPHIVGSEGYLLAAFGDRTPEIIVAANGPQGAFYGIVTLVQLIALDGSVPGVLVVDFPSQRIRGTYEPGSAPFEWRDGTYHFTDGQRAFIDWLASMKMNTMFLVENGAFFRPESAWLEAYQQLFAYARERFVEPVPRVCSISSVSPFPFELFEGWYVSNERFRFDGDGMAVAESPYRQLVVNGGFEDDSDGDGIPDGWSMRSQPGATWSIDETAPFAGRRAMRLDIPSGAPDSSSAVLSTVIHAVEPDSHYCVWSKAWAQSIVDVRPQLTVYVRDTMGNVAVLQSDVTWSTSGWIDFGACLRTPPNPDTITIYARIQTPGSGTFRLDDVQMFRVDGGLRNVIRTADTDIRLTDITGAQAYQLGTDFTVQDGARQMKFVPTLEPFVIRREPAGRIGLDDTVLVSYDAYFFYAASHYWSSAPCLACEALYTDYYFPAIDALVARLHPKILNIDADEVRGFYRDSRLRARFDSNAEAIAYWANRIAAHLAEVDPQCRLWIWDDMVSPYHNGGVADYQVPYGGLEGRMAEATESDWIDKSILMDIWWYGDNWLSQMWQSIRYFTDHGYEVLGSPWASEENIDSWAEMLVGRPGALGGVETNWGTPYEASHRAFADAFWNTPYRLLAFDSFESDADADGIPDGWTVEGGIRYPTDGSASYGTRYAGFPNAAVGIASDTRAVRSSQVPVRPNETYRLSVYARRDTGGDASPSLHLDWLDADGKSVGDSSLRLEPLTGDYRKFEAEMIAAPGAASAVIALDPTVPDVWYDVVRLAERSGFLAIVGPERLAAAMVGSAYRQDLRVAGGQSPYLWRADWSSRAPGLALDETGSLAGVPRLAGAYRLTIVVADHADRIASRTYDLIVRDWEATHAAFLPCVTAPRP